MALLSDINLWMSLFLLVVLSFYLRQVHRLLRGKELLEFKESTAKEIQKNASA